MISHLLIRYYSNKNVKKYYKKIDQKVSQDQIQLLSVPDICLVYFVLIKVKKNYKNIRLIHRIN